MRILVTYLDEGINLCVLVPAFLVIVITLIILYVRHLHYHLKEK